MKYLVGIARIIVGFLFVISGLIKLNDPVGFAFKLQDYFAPEVLNLEFLMPYALPLAILLVIVEVLVGVALLIGYFKRLTLWLLLLMIVFFTFLTFYSAYFNKVTDCGCFGDAIPLTPWESFYKDVVLLVLIIILFVGSKYIRPIFTRSIRSIIVLFSLVICLAIGYHVLQHLPIIDFRPYKIGANIRESMEIPEDAPKPLFEYRWKFNVDGAEKIVVTHGDYPDVEGEFIDVDTKMIHPGYTPPIEDFFIERNGEDQTDYLLSKEHLILVVAYSLDNTERQGYAAIKEVTDRAIANGYEVVGVSASSQEATEELANNYGLNFKFYFSDETALKTIVRSNPGLLELNKGTIKQKYHWNDAHKMTLPKVEGSESGRLDIAQKLQEISETEEKLNQLMQSVDLEERITLGKELGLSEVEATGDLSKLQSVMDSTHMVYVENIFSTKGYPGKSMVGEPLNVVAWEVLQRNPDKIGEYMDLINEAGKSGELPKEKVATMEDYYLMLNKLPQKYGTQGMIKSNGAKFVWPIEDAENVNQRRKEVGFDLTVEEYAKQIFGENFEYEVLTMDEVNTE